MSDVPKWKDVDNSELAPPARTSRSNAFSLFGRHWQPERCRTLYGPRFRYPIHPSTTAFSSHFHGKCFIFGFFFSFAKASDFSALASRISLSEERAKWSLRTRANKKKKKRRKFAGRVWAYSTYVVYHVVSYSTSESYSPSVVYGTYHQR